MAEKLTQIPKPKAASFKAGRKIYLVASMFGFQGVPNELEVKLQSYWSDVRSQIENLEQTLTQVTHVFHEGIFESGQTGLAAIITINPYAHTFINTLCKSTATLESLEDRSLVQEEYDWRMCSSAGVTSEKVYSLIINNLEDTTNKRWAHASKTIDELIPKDDAALLIVNQNHKIQFPEDMQVFYISPPSFDAVKRWVDNQIKLMVEAQRKSSDVTENEPEKTSDKDKSDKGKESTNDNGGTDKDKPIDYPY